jgi:hypothetical protein
VRHTPLQHVVDGDAQAADARLAVPLPGLDGDALPVVHDERVRPATTEGRTTRALEQGFRPLVSQVGERVHGCAPSLRLRQRGACHKQSGDLVKEGEEVTIMIKTASAGTA